ncbi:hypothetical protein N9J72_02995 [Candidatus Gracilibacteria bacterium]|nr:hypothetical protein [Candidatus Gracilibacteria bacterium]
MEDTILDMLDDFQENLFEAQSFRKKFKVGNREITELEFGGDWRCLCEVEIIDEKIYLLNIGTHSSLELSSRKKMNI